jgi:hypothetical protein
MILLGFEETYGAHVPCPGGPSQFDRLEAAFAAKHH